MCKFRQKMHIPQCKLFYFGEIARYSTLFLYFCTHMTKRSTFLFPLLLLAVGAMAQTEQSHGWTPAGTYEGRPPAAMYSMAVRMNAMQKYAESPMPVPLEMKEVGAQTLNTTKGFTLQTAAGGAGFGLWRGAYLGVYGTNYHLPGLMNTATGSIALHQDLGRWHLTGMATADKYWMPWQHRLATQYGFGGTVGYDLSDAVTLHAFGYYYANQLQVGPAMSPYMNTTTFGGYADVRFNSVLGANMGVRRYVNPMNGKWTTEPIVNPYIKIGKDSKIELPLGGLLKSLIWGDEDNPMRFRPHPMSRPPVKR